VLGCHSKLEAVKDRWYKLGSCRDQWPADNGTTCLCRGTYGYYEHKGSFSHSENKFYYIIPDFNLLRYGSYYSGFEEDDPHGVHQCIATCADDIQNHHVNHSDGTGLVTADCPEGMAVLGCGSASTIDAVDNSTNSTAATHSTDPTRSRLRAAVVVNTTNSCRCYDQYQVMCYAVCSMFDSSYEIGRLSTATRVGCDSLQKTAILCVLGLLLILAERD